MAERLLAEKFLLHPGKLLDVRSPLEYDKGHIPGAVSMPLFTDEERALVGTAYHKEGRDVAMKLGLEAAGRKLADLVKKAQDYSTGNGVRIYCWRGGMRSGSVAWLLETAGMNCVLLEGGYKAYRRHALESYHREAKLIIVGGLTGTGKTEILHLLRDAGEQVIDLENLARHRGSLFGAIEEAQPTCEHFQNLFFEEWRKIDPAKPLWLEDESLAIGNVYLPSDLHKHMQAAPLLFAEVPNEMRIQRLVRDYVAIDPEVLLKPLQRLSKRLGSDRATMISNWIREKNYPLAAEELLKYYDKMYLYDVSERNPELVFRVKVLDNNGSFSVKPLIEKCRQIYG